MLLALIARCKLRLEVQIKGPIGKPQVGILWSRDSLGFKDYVEIILELSGLHSEL